VVSSATENVYAREKDLFGAFDIECWKRGAPNVKKYVQVTAYPNGSARIKKVFTFSGPRTFTRTVLKSGSM
jgi:hypothetical protein